MQLKIQSKKDNHLLQRKEVLAAVEFDGATPSNAEVIASLASQLGVAVGNVDLQKIGIKYGHRNGVVRAMIYASPELKKKMILMTSTSKKKAAEDAKKVAEAQKAVVQ